MGRFFRVLVALSLVVGCAANDDFGTDSFVGATESLEIIDDLGPEQDLSPSFISRSLRSGTEVAATFDGSGTMLAWKSESRVWAVRYAADGTRGSEYLLSADLPHGFDAIRALRYRSQIGVANVGDRYLISFRSEYDRLGKWDIGAILMSADGTVLSDFYVTNEIRDQEYPVIEADGANFLVAWRDALSRRGPDDVPAVYAARITPDGVNLDPDPIDLGMDDSVGAISIAYGAGVYMVRAGSTARTMSPDGATISPVFSVGGPGELASDGTNFLNAYLDTSGNLDLELLSVAGVVLATADDVMTGVTNFDVSSNGAGFQIGTVAGGDAFLTQVSSSLSVGAPLLIAPAQNCVTIASGGDETLTSTCDTTLPPQYGFSPTPVAHRVDLPTDEVVDGPSIVARRNAPGLVTGVATDGTDFAVVYEDVRVGSYLTIVSEDGTAGEERVLSSVGNTTPHVAFSAGVYLVTWTEMGVMHWARFSPAGVELARGVHASVPTLYTRLVAFGSSFVVAYGGRTEIKLATMASDGSLGTPTSTSIATSLVAPMRLAALPNRLALAWRGSNVRVFDESLVAVPTDVLPTTAANVEIAAGAGLFALTSSAAGSTYIYRVSADGDLLDPLGTEILGTSYDTELTFDGEFFVAVGDRDPPSGSRTRRTYMRPDGTFVDRLGTQIAYEGARDMITHGFLSRGDGLSLWVYYVSESLSSDLRFRMHGAPSTSGALGNACAESAECGSGFCVDGVCCESACVGTCDACGEAGMFGECVSISGAPRGDRDGCLMCVDGVCDDGTAGGLGDVCVADAECAGGHCVDGFCCERACTGDCKACDVPGSEGMCEPISGAPHGDRDGCDACLMGSCADGGGGMLNRGEACDADAECMDGHCVDGVCCQWGCAGTCKACGEPGDEGYCVPISGAPRGDRTGCLTCDEGACIDDAGAGTLGAECALDSECESGACTDGVCCERACRGDCKACAEPGFEGMCVPVSGAPRGERDGCSFCDVGVCSEVGTLGSACGDDSLCESGFCVDGVCCERACRGTCKACGEPGSEGMCVAVSGAPRGDRDGCPSCDAGVCVGADPLGTACAADGDCESGFCTDGVCCERLCAGTCKACGEPGLEGMCVPVSGAPRGDRTGCVTCDVGVCGG